jgi:peptidyl-prolyl cis-trans isomerase A (cyclophilin A)
MSYLGKILFICYCVTSLFNQCEDTKKQHNVIPKNQQSTAVRFSKSTLSNTLDIEKKDTAYPPEKLEKITEENVVKLLTKFGEENLETKVELTTPYGSIVIELFKDTPLHRANFIYLVKQGYFNTTYFHRVVSDFIIQAGTSDNRKTQDERYAIGHTYRIPNEINRKHAYGTLSGAKYYRDNDDNKTEPFEFYIFLGPKTATKHLDGNYTVFGKVINGMGVVREISKLPKDAKEWPLQNVTITAKTL